MAWQDAVEPVELPVASGPHMSYIMRRRLT